MRKLHAAATIILAMSILALPALAEEAKLFTDVYPYLSSSGLKYAKLVELPENIVLRCNGKVITVEQLPEIKKNMPGFIAGMVENDNLLLLELFATTAIFADEAREALEAAGVDIKGMSGAQITGTYTAKLVEDMKLTVSDEEVAHAMRNSSDKDNKVFQERTRKALLEKKSKLASIMVNHELGKRVPIELSESWVKEQVANMKDTPIDTARKSGRPSVVVFISGKKTNQKERQEKSQVIAKVLKEYEGKLEIVALELGNCIPLATRYGVTFGTPAAFFFFDKKGKEVSHYMEYLTEEEFKAELDKLLKAE